MSSHLETSTRSPEITSAKTGHLAQMCLDDLDYMHARYYSPHMGRFLSVDPTQRSAKPKLAQSWNRYAYTLNNPMKYVDPDGEAWTPPPWLNTAGSIVAGFLPGLGEFQDATIAVTGFDPVTSTRESTSTRIVSGLALAVPFVGGKALSEFGGLVFAADKSGAGSGASRLGSEIVESAKSSIKAGDVKRLTKGGLKSIGISNAEKFKGQFVERGSQFDIGKTSDGRIVLISKDNKILDTELTVKQLLEPLKE